MRDCFELIDISAYMVGCGLLLPAVYVMGRDSPWAILLMLALFLPLPIYLARFYFSLPVAIDALLEKYAYALLIVGVGFAVGLLSTHVYQWAWLGNRAAVTPIREYVA